MPWFPFAYLTVQSFIPPLPSHPSLGPALCGPPRTWNWQDKAETLPVLQVSQQKNLIPSLSFQTPPTRTQHEQIPRGGSCWRGGGGAGKAHRPPPPEPPAEDCELAPTLSKPNMQKPGFGWLPKPCTLGTVRDCRDHHPLWPPHNAGVWRVNGDRRLKVTQMSLSSR